MAGPRWARCYSWGHGYCWALVTPVGVSGIWTLWYWIFSPHVQYDMVWPGSLPSPSFVGPRRAMVFPFLCRHYLWGQCLWGQDRASVLTGGGEWMLLQVFDHPHWVKFDVYSKVCPLLTPEFFRTGTTFFKSIVENLTRDYTTVGLSL